MSARTSMASAERVTATMDKHGFRREAVIVRGLINDLRDERRFGGEMAAKLAEARAKLDAIFRAEKSKSEPFSAGGSPSESQGDGDTLSSPPLPVALADPLNPAPHGDGKEPARAEVNAIRTEAARVAAPEPVLGSNLAGSGVKYSKREQKAARNAAIVEAYAADIAMDQIEREHGVGHELIRRLARKAGLPPRAAPHCSPAEKAAASARNRQIVEAYEAGKTPKEIGTEHGLGPCRILQILKAEVIERREPGHNREKSAARKAAAIEAYTSGQSVEEVARNLGVQNPAIHKILREAGVPLRSRAKAVPPPVEKMKPTDSEVAAIKRAVSAVASSAAPAPQPLVKEAADPTPRRDASVFPLGDTPMGVAIKDKSKLDPLAKRIIELHGMAPPTSADLNPPRFMRMGVGGA